jgi:integrase
MEYQYQKFIAPVIGNLQPMEIANRHIITILSSITDSETTRTKTQAVLSLLLQWLVTQNYIDVDESRINWQLIRKALPPCTSTSKNYPRMAIEDVPRFVALALSPQETDYDTITGIAAVLLLLTAQRAGNFLEMDSQPTGEASGWFSKWRDIDLQRRVWTIPPECLKISRSANNRQVRPLRIPLAEQTVDVLMLIRKFWRRRGIELGPDDFVVPKFDDFSRPHKSCSVRLFIQRVHQADLDSGGKGFFDPEQPGRIATTHGFRSDFEDWCISQDYSSLYADKALAHELPNKVQKAYQRNDFLEERRPMMTAWASYCASQISKGS